MAAGLPVSALIGVRHALERGRDGQPVGTALLGTVIALVAGVVAAANVVAAIPALLAARSQPALLLRAE